MQDSGSLINEILTNIGKQKDEVSVLNKSYKDSFENDSDYHDLSEKKKEITRQMKVLKDQIVKNNTGVAAIQKDLETAKWDLKDLKEQLSNVLKAYKEETGSQTFETDDGEMLNIEEILKLVKSS